MFQSYLEKHMAQREKHLYPIDFRGPKEGKDHTSLLREEMVTARETWKHNTHDEPSSPDRGFHRVHHNRPLSPDAVHYEPTMRGDMFFSPLATNVSPRRGEFVGARPVSPKSPRRKRKTNTNTSGLTGDTSLPSFTRDNTTLLDTTADTLAFTRDESISLPSRPASASRVRPQSAVRTEEGDDYSHPERSSRPPSASRPGSALRRAASARDVAKEFSGAILDGRVRVEARPPSGKRPPSAERTLSRPGSAKDLRRPLSASTAGNITAAEWRTLSRPGSAKNLAKQLRLSQRPTSAGTGSATLSRPVSAGRSFFSGTTLPLDVALDSVKEQKEAEQGEGKAKGKENRPATRRTGAAEDSYLAEHEPFEARAGKKYPYWLYDNDPRTADAEKVGVNGVYKEKCHGVFPHRAGPVKHPLPFRQTLAGPQGKSFSQHGPNPADPVAYHLKLSPLGTNLQLTPGVCA